MKSKKIVLVGMMGSGKSAVSKVLSQKLGYKLLECDEIFEEKFDIKISDFFSKFGEAEFRKREFEILKSILSDNLNNFVVSTGGGAILKKENRDIIFNDDTISIYLKASPEAIFERIKNDETRPLLKVQNPKLEIEKILSQREEFYNLAHFTIENENKTIEKVADEMILKVKYEKNWDWKYRKY